MERKTTRRRTRLATCGSPSCAGKHQFEVPGPPTGNGPAADHPFTFQKILSLRSVAICHDRITKL